MSAKATTVTMSAGGESVTAPMDRFRSYSGGRFGRHDLTPPSAATFADPDGGTAEFLPALNLDSRLARLVGKYPELSHLGGVEIRCLWKASGGKSGGKNVLGKCQKLTGLARYFSGEESGVSVDFIIWLAADHLADYDERAIEAVLYHECCHIGWDEEGDKPVVVAHEFAGFLGELERYGLYALDLQNLGQTMRQLRLGEAGGA